MADLASPSSNLVGMVHLAGWPHDAGGEATIGAVVDDAMMDTTRLVDAGFTSIMVQNLGSRSSWRAETPHEIACLTMLMTRLRHEHPHIRFGLNMPSDDPSASLAVAYATGASFVRLKVWIGVMRRLEGTLDGCAYEALQYRHRLAAGEVEIWADVLDRTGDPVWPTDFGRAMEEATFTGVTTIVVTAADHAQLLTRLRTAREIAPRMSLVVGGGASLDNVGELLSLADGVIVGTALKERTVEGRVSSQFARSFLDAGRIAAIGDGTGAGPASEADVPI
jgi:membrane complex biogenesis BtpA family protein